MSPSEAAKGAKRWRYYISQAILQGRKQDAGSVARVSAPQIEAKILEALQEAMGENDVPPESLRDLARQDHDRSERPPDPMERSALTGRADRVRSLFPGRRRRPNGGARSFKATEDREPIFGR